MRGEKRFPRGTRASLLPRVFGLHDNYRGKHVYPGHCATPFRPGAFNGDKMNVILMRMTNCVAVLSYDKGTIGVWPSTYSEKGPNLCLHRCQKCPCSLCATKSRMKMFLNWHVILSTYWTLFWIIYDKKKWTWVPKDRNGPFRWDS